MPQTQKRTDELLKKANSLPLTPGVYIMKDRNGKVIYVGKSRKLKNRVSQYFQNSLKNLKTEKMVRLAEDFEYILCQSEIEALTLENSLIKKYSPKYNIRLKDSKQYPYIKITAEEYPRVIYTRKRLADKGKYFGPFTGTSTIHAIIDIIYKSLGIPNCKRSFPRDIGKERPCIYYQMKKCCGLCTGNVSKEEYDSLVKCAIDMLRGNTSKTIDTIEQQMLAFAEQENFEAAAKCRDTIAALKNLSEKQHMVASPDTDMDIFGYYNDELASCISAMYVRYGAVSDKYDFTFDSDAQTDSGALSAFLVEHYNRYDYIPRNIVVSFELDEADKDTLEKYFSERAGRKVTLHRPERGDIKKLCDTVVSNAAEKARQLKLQMQNDESVLAKLATLLALETLPQRIEAYDISNIGAENITAGMVVYEDGKPKKSDYRTFSIKSVDGIDDYSSMREALTRRILRLKSEKSGSFAQIPDLILIDGGRGHISTVKAVLENEGVDIPVFGMVKDDFHKTRALCTDTEEINIAKEKAVFGLIYRIQEEVHRYTVGRTTNAKRSTLKHSSLENIKGIGPAKAKALLLHFGTFSAVKSADITALEVVPGISQTDAENIYNYFNSKG
ncbi:MAG: excinuclease ABC subunit UvrC [Clostridia bacterium]|nr:excinuclease ABC subunit UvrC [Clostridia bacterium]